ncbi:MAG: pyridoxal phosphate-dependent aminotransferase [Clostridia bacterium]|nr:pyridoxal phosphate-dependent aminotransferase [Clostridia bacterium]
MQQYNKASKLDHVSYDVRGPIVQEAARMSAQGIRILKLNIGNPAPFGFHAPQEIIDDMQRMLQKAEGYSESKGVPAAREAILQYCQLKGIPNVTLDDIFTGNGASELISMAMQGLLDKGDEILIPAPDYPLWTASATLAGGVVRHYRCDEANHWYPDLEDIERQINDRTKGIVVINPNNPTGVLYSEEVLRGIVDIARRHHLILFADEIYDRLVYDGKKHIALASLCPDLFCVNFNGLSKSHRIAGFRSGWMCLSGDKSYAKGYIEGLTMLSSMRLCANVPAQMIIPTALKDAQRVDDLLLPGGRLYEQREVVVNALEKIPGISAVRPEGAFYIFPKIDVERFGIKNDEQMMLDLLHQKHVLMIPGKGFNWPEPDHFRIVTLPDKETLADAMEKLADFLTTYRQN